MAEKIIIAQLDIDTDKLLERQALLLSQIKELKKELTNLQAEVEKKGASLALIAKEAEILKNNIAVLRKEYATNKRVLVETATSTKSYEDALKREISTINEAKNNNKELVAIRNNLSASTEEGRAKIESINAKIAENNEIIKTNSKAVKENTDTQRGLNEVLQQEVGSINEARANNKELVAIRNSLSKSSDDYAKKVAEINAKINENNNFIKANVSALEQQKIGIGGYSDGVVKAAEALGLQGRPLELVTTLTNRLKNTQQAQATAQEAANVATNKGVKTLNLLKVALASTGIGLIVVALGSLVAYFQRTEDGGNKLKVMFAAVGNVVNQLMEPLVKIGETIVKVFTNPQESIKKFGNLIKQNILNRFEGAKNVIGSAAKAIGAFFRGDWDEAWEAAKDTAWSAQQAITGITEEGWEKAGKAVADYGKNVADTTKKAVALQERENKLHQENRDWLVKKKEMENQIVDLKRISQDQTKSLAEREKAGAKALELQEEIRKRDVDLAQEEYDIIKEKNGLASSNMQDLDAEADALARVNQVAFEGGQKMIELNNQLNTVKKQGATEEAARIKKNAEETVKKAEEELRLFEIQEEQKRIADGNRERTNAEELEYTRQLYEKKRAIVEASFRNGLIDKAEYDRRIIEMDNETNSRISEISKNMTLEKARYDLELFEAEQERWRLSKKNHELNYTEQLLQEAGFYERKKALALASFEAGEMDQQAYNLRLLELENEHIAALNDINDDERERRKEQEQIDFEEELLKAENDYERRQMELDRWREQELANENLTEEQRLSIEKQYTEAGKALEREKQEYNLNLASDALGAVSDLLGKNTAAGKAAAVAQATINTYLAASQVLTEPDISIFAKIAKMAIAIGTGLANVNKIVGISLPKFEDGGSFIVGGNRHSAGGTKFYGSDGSAFEAEAGEMITISSRSATAAYARNISASNVSIGGRGIRSMMPSGYGSGATAKTMEKMNDRPVVVQVVDIVDGVERRTDVIDIATV